jgi:hypothetical protein
VAAVSRAASSGRAICQRGIVAIGEVVSNLGVNWLSSQYVSDGVRGRL